MSDENLPQVGATTQSIQNMLTGNQVAPTTGGGLPFLRFDAKRTGQWLIGTDSEECSEEVFALDVATLMHGWILWHQRKANRRLVPINQPLPQPQEPVHYTDSKGQPATDEAAEARSFEGSFTEDGTKFLLEMSTFGGRKAIDALLAELFMRANQGSAFLFPQVRLESDSYDHSQYGLVYEPVLTPVAWYDENGNAEGEALDAPEDVQEEPPAKKTRKRKAKPKQEAAHPEDPQDPHAEQPEDPDPAPTNGTGRRRRRRAAS